ncbi:hypothetical protein CHLNCDRAFT_139072 [Chlorella variabilis]|uniref:J domain-containing protein n=1 Tax=Chlorella variabilis TaxID=554065 RepID=E1ZPA8_CHLVA|nr:hypothetical protein CHLNCDRAFT_139072 [Chlorella variabilis]EFN52222.1 hypothetical protein CHLNCDRAFT_139072 [Chlorella variabilis]|eukprot:XP_005844324.1 hypothetical protein CHLNCDRAFT_139072 [Chlorella variabilis]
MAGAGQDPYEVLGIPSNADYNAIQRAYKKRVSEVKGRDEAALQQIEAAHSAIMMAQLTSRLKGNVSVEKDVLYADRAKYFPWRPRLWMAAYDILLYSALAQALMLAWALLSPLTAGTQPVIWSAIAGAVGNIIKQNRLYPVPKGGPDSPPDEKKQGGKNIMRGFLLAFMATFSGCLLFYTLPDAIAASMGRVMPAAFYEGQALQTMLLAIGSCILNWLFTAFTR